MATSPKRFRSLSARLTVQFALLFAAAMLVGVAMAGTRAESDGGAATATVDQSSAIVELKGEPLATSDKTAPAKGKKLDLGLIAGEYASALMAKPDTRLRIIIAMYSSPGLFIVKGDSPARSIADLKGKPVVLGTQGPMM